jgi:hypothetical protein
VSSAPSAAILALSASSEPASPPSADAGAAAGAARADSTAARIQPTTTRQATASRTLKHGTTRGSSAAGTSRATSASTRQTYQSPCSGQSGWSDWKPPLRLGVERRSSECEAVTTCASRSRSCAVLRPAVTSSVILSFEADRPAQIPAGPQ